MLSTEATNKEALQSFDRLLQIIKELRAKCPWHKQQTISGLRPLTIEEAFELSEAILKENMNSIQEELGDVLLHILLYINMAAESKAFTLADCINALCNKLMQRHSHIYQHTDKTVDAQDVKRNWQQQKLKEKGRESVLEGTPASLPTFIKALRIQAKALAAGFGWKEHKDAWNKLQEELQELAEEVTHHSEANPRQAQIEEELGDVLFVLLKYAFFINVDPEKALEIANQKFIRRFQQIERQLKEDHKQFTELSVDEIEAYWQKAKAHLKSSSIT